MVEQAIGNWTKEVGLSLEDADMWQRRADLRGAPIRITSIKYPVFSEEFVLDSYGRPTVEGGKGYLLDMLRIMMRDLTYMTSACMITPSIVAHIWLLVYTNNIHASAPVQTSCKHRPLRDLNFTAPLSLSVDGKFGGKNKDGSWNGMVGMLTRNETGKEHIE